MTPKPSDEKILSVFDSLAPQPLVKRVNITALNIGCTYCDVVNALYRRGSLVLSQATPTPVKIDKTVTPDAG